MQSRITTLFIHSQAVCILKSDATEASITYNLQQNKKVSLGCAQQQ